MEEIVFMAVRNCQASLPPPRASSKAAIAYGNTVSFCHMMAMGEARKKQGACEGRYLLVEDSYISGRRVS